MHNNKIFFIILMFFTTFFSYGQENQKSSSNPLIGGWTVYDQQLGAIDGKFFTTGGVSAGISILGISIGLGVHGSYPFTPPLFYVNNFQFYYGGLVVGYKSTWKTFGFRIFALVGMSSIENNNTFKLNFIVSPSLHIDWHIFRSLVLSVGMNYRYIVNNQSAIDMNYWKNSISGTVSLGWVH